MKKKTILIVSILLIATVFSFIMVGCSKDITITFDLGYDNIKSIEEYNSSQKITLFTPKREGYVFCYWQDANGEKKEGTLSFKEDTTLYAVWGVEIDYYVDDEKIHTGALELGKTLAQGADVTLQDDSLTITGYYTTDENGDFLNDVTNAQIKEKMSVNVSVMTKGLTIEKVRSQVSGEDEVTVTKYAGTSEKVIIPTLYNNEMVTSISNYTRNVNESNSVATGAFEAIYNEATNSYFPIVKEIKLPNTLTILDNMALKNAIYLKEVYIPKNVELFGVGVLTNTTKESSVLEKVEFAADCKLKDTNFEAFGENKNLITVILPDGLEILGDSAFRGCSSLKRIDLKNVTTLRRAVFWECTALKELHIPSTVTIIQTSYVDDSFLSGVPEMGKKSLIDGIGRNTGIKIYVDHSSLDGLNYEGGWHCYNYTDNYMETTNIPVFFKARNIKYKTLINGLPVEMYLYDVHLGMGHYSPAVRPPAEYLEKDRTYIGMKVAGDENNRIVISPAGEYFYADREIVSNEDTLFEIVYAEQEN